MLSTSYVLCGHLNILFERLPIQVICSVFNQIVWFFLLLSCMNSLCILVVNPLSDMWFANISFHSTDCLFILLMLILLCRSFQFACGPYFFMSFLDVISKNRLPRFMSRNFSSFSFRTFVSFRSYVFVFNSFEFIFVSGIQPFYSFIFFYFYSYSIFILLHVNIPFFTLKRSPFLH